MLEVLDEWAVGRWSGAVVDALGRARASLDELNVFPVPDGDTGSNLLLTARSADDELAASAGSGPPWAALARGAVLGARGNSGAILAQLLSGLADALAGAGPVDGRTLAVALDAAARTAYTAVADPAEGTFLTVARAGAEAARGCVAGGGTTLAEVVAAAAEGARAALRRTTDQLEQLRDAGVVDAGGAGWCLVLDALVGTVTGVEPARPALQRPVHPAGHEHALHQPGPGAGSEVQFLLADSDQAAVDRLGAELAALGDCLVVVGVDTPEGRQWNVHVHVPDVGAAIEAGIRAGRPHRLTVTPLAPVPPPAPQAGTRAVVAVVPAPGLAGLLEGEGVVVLVGGAGEVTEDALLAAVLGTGAGDVVVLPDDTALAGPAARAAARARQEGREVAVLPTRSPLQALAAIAVADPTRRFADDVIAMTEAAAATRWAEVDVADTEALTLAGRCRPGDTLGVVEGEVVLVGAEQETVVRELLDRLLAAGGELVTLVGGELAGRGAAHVTARHPTVEVTCHAGGPGARPLLIGVE